MKKITLCLSGLLGIVTLSTAQISIASSDFANVGDTLYYGSDTTDVTSGIALESGTNRTWNISSAARNEVKSCVFLNPGSSPITAPANITHVMVDGDVQNTRFLNISSSVMETVLANPMSAFLGGEAFIRLKSLTFPATYLTQIRDTFKTQQIVPAGMIGLSSLADSIRATLTVKLHNLCDGWGTLITPIDSYPVLRFRNRVTVDVKLEGKKNVLPLWVNIPLSSLPVPVPSNETTTNIIWVHNNGKYFLAEATLKTNDETVQTNLRYQIPKPLASGIARNELATLNASVFPNPTSGLLTIQAELLPNQNYKLLISDITGRIVKEEQISSSSDKLLMNVNDLKNGIYYLKITNGTSESNLKFVVAK
ncbi:MAG: T9SS type A sorting domain-containing protein [Bacteroidia bacterium]|nr:T9SS type A sorting domain-containing protein [Bacteroidia bacterium]